MKLQLDTTNKTIKVENNIKFADLIEVLERILPKGEWKKYELQTETITNWSNPIIIKEYEKQVYPWWGNRPYITNCHNTSGQYCVEY